MKRPPRAAATEITKRVTLERVVVRDPDYVADLEQADAQLRKRMAARDRGKPVNRPRDPS